MNRNRPQSPHSALPPAAAPTRSTVEFGLLAWLEETRVALPLKSVDCRFQVTGPVASVEMDQVFHQNAARPLDCTYLFPLPAGAAVYRCELQINGRVIRAKVEEQGAARKIYREQKAAGRRAALVEAERENLFTLSLGNVQADDLIVVRLAWLQNLARTGAGLRLLVPTCPGVRYIPGQPLLRGASGRGIADDTDQVPDASRIVPPRIDAFHPDAAFFSLAGHLPAGDVVSGSASSPTHPILVRESGDRVAIELSGHDAVPDRDFVLAWREPLEGQLTPRAWRWNEGAEAYALVQLRAPAEVAVTADYPQDFYFLIDRSGSMGGSKWQRTCSALQAFVQLLGAADRVWITLFETTFRDFAEAPLPAPKVLRDAGFLGLEALGVAGGTNLLPAAQHVLGQITRHSAGRTPTVVLITDGQVGNDEAIVRAFRAAPQVRVHAFGIDTAVNDAFLRSLARQQRGECWLRTPHDDIAGDIAGLGARLRRPVVVGLSAGAAWQPAREGWPDLHAEETVALSLRGELEAPLEICGRLPDGREWRFAARFESQASEGVKLLWAREKITTLLDADRSAEAIALAKQHNLVCRGAAFVAWDEAEQVEVAREEIVQPALEAELHARTVKLAQSRPLSSMPGLHAFAVRRGKPASPMPDSDSLRLAERVCDAPDPARPPAEELAALLQRAGLDSAKAVALAAWLDRGPANGSTEKVAAAAQCIVGLRLQAPGMALAGVLDQQLAQAQQKSPARLSAWLPAFAERLSEALKYRGQLMAADAPPELCDLVVSWSLEAPEETALRSKGLAALCDSLASGCFSASSRTAAWRKFLASAVAADHPIQQSIRDWLDAPQPVLSRQS